MLRPITTFLILFCFVFTSSAQQDLMMLNLHSVMQSSYVNPALGSSSGIHVGLPFLSSVSAQHNNNFLNPDGLFATGETGGIEIQTDVFLSRLSKNNRFGFDLTADVFSIGIPIKGQYFSFAIREKASAHLQLSEDLLRFPVIGNGAFDEHGGRLDLGDMSLQLDHYVEYGFGWQKNINKKLDIGIRAKVLFGKENVRTTNNSFTWVTDPENYTWSFEGDFDIQTSGLQNQLDSIDGNSLLENGKVGKYLFSSKNRGLGLDLGVNYQVNSRWDAGLSVVDLGYIRYKDSNTSYTGSGSDVVFAGVEITEAFVSGDASFADSLDAAIADLGDALAESVGLVEGSEAYTVGLNTRIYGTLGYMLLRKKNSFGRAGLILHSGYRGGELTPTMAMLSYTHSWSDRFTASLSYSVLEKERKNMGLSFAVRTGPGIFYMSFDNLLWTRLSKFDIAGPGGEWSYPSFSQNSGIHFGMNLLLNKKDKTANTQSRLE